MQKRLLQIGCGAWGQNLLRVGSNLCVLTAACDRNPKIVKKIAKDYNIKTFTDIEEALTESDCDAVILATRDHSHFDIGTRVLNAGYDLFVEKPLATSLQKVQTLVDLAEQSERLLMCGLLLRYHAVFDAVIATLPALGTIRSVESIRHDQLAQPRDLDLIWGYAPHDATLLAGLLYRDDPPAQLRALPLRVSGDAHTAVHIAGTLDNVDFVFDLAWNQPLFRQLTIMGEHGTLVWNDRPWQTLQLTLSSGEQRHIPFLGTEPLTQELVHFLDCLDTRTEPLTSGRRSVFVHALVDRIAHALPATVADTG